MSQAGVRPFLAWPGWPHLRLAYGLTCAVTILFCIVFGGCDWLTAHRSDRVRVHLDAELKLPLIPAFTVVYTSIYAAFGLVPFVLRVRPEVIRLAVTQAVVILVAGVGFLLVPATLAYAPPAEGELGRWKALFDFADRLNLDYNLVPSLHVALSIVCLETYAAHTTRKTLLRLWAVAIAASTLFTHQHHLVDAVSGYALGWGAVRLARSKHRAERTEH